MSSASPTAADRAKGLGIGSLGILVLVGYAIGGRWRLLAEYCYTLGLAGIFAMFLWMMRTDGKWEETVRHGQQLWGRCFAHRYPKFLTTRSWGWIAAALFGANVLFRTIGHVT